MRAYGTVDIFDRRRPMPRVAVLRPATAFGGRVTRPLSPSTAGRGDEPVVAGPVLTGDEVDPDSVLKLDPSVVRNRSRFARAAAAADALGAGDGQYRQRADVLGDHVNVEASPLSWTSTRYSRFSCARWPPGASAAIVGATRSGARSAADRSLTHHADPPDPTCRPHRACCRAPGTWAARCAVPTRDSDNGGAGALSSTVTGSGLVCTRMPSTQKCPGLTDNRSPLMVIANRPPPPAHRSDRPGR